MTGRSLRTFALFSALAVIVASGAFFWLRARVALDRSLPRAETNVVVPTGATGHEVAALLAKDGVIASPLTFELLARYRGEQSALRAGEFRFAPHQTQNEILRQLVEGGGQTALWITIPEGFTAKQIAAALAAHRLGAAADYERRFMHGSLTLGGTRTPSLEGYLFPDTYLVAIDADPAAVVKRFTDQFATELPSGAAARAKALGLTLPEVVTLASLVEREAKADDERPLIAGVYYNRLHRGMPLEVDASIEYAFPQHKAVITYADLAIDSPYNTYKHTGLPPTPIANPGLPSLRAALYPKTSDYLYYVYMGNGHHAFSRTLAEHNANVARYLR